MKNLMQNSDWKKTILNGIIVILALVLIARTAYTIQVYVQMDGEEYMENNMLHRLKNEDFGDMVMIYHSNVALGYEDKKELQDYYGIARYYEAAANYKMYLENEEPEKAEREKRKMQEAADDFGELYFVKDKIDAKLALQELQ